MAATVPAFPLLEVEGLAKSYAVGGVLGRTKRLRALHDVAFTVDRGEAVALVGESGSGKSTIARQIARLERPDGGHIRLDGVDVLASERRTASLGYRQRVQMIFQDPFGLLNPVHTVAHHLERPLLRHGRATAPTCGRCWRCSTRSASTWPPTSPTSTRTRSPAGSASASPSPAPSRSPILVLPG
ncbi:MAG: ATP-binding cassette domain-containing protein [Myxococcota bacterium]